MLTILPCTHPACLHGCVRSPHFSLKSSVSFFNIVPQEKMSAFHALQWATQGQQEWWGKKDSAEGKWLHCYWCHHAFLRPCFSKEWDYCVTEKHPPKRPSMMLSEAKWLLRSLLFSTYSQVYCLWLLGKHVEKRWFWCRKTSDSGK